MPGTLVPPWYTTPELRRTDVILSSFLWGFTMSLAIFSATKGFRQTYRSWTRSHRMNAYIVMIWLEWVAGVVVAVVCWLYIMDLIPPRCVSRASSLLLRLVADRGHSVQLLVLYRHA